MADRRWMDKLTKVINTTWDPAGNDFVASVTDNEANIILTRSADPTRPIQNTYLGSDDYLRARFEEYIMSLLSSVKYAQAFDPKNAFKTETALEDVIRDEEKGKYRIRMCVNSCTSSSTETMNCFFSKYKVS